MEEYIVLENEENLGEVVISTEVIRHITLIEIEDEKDARAAGTLFKNTITCNLEEGKLKISANIDIRFKANVNEVTSRLQKRIEESISHMTNYEIKEINLNVQGFIID